MRRHGNDSHISLKTMFKYFRVIFQLIFICITCKLQLYLDGNNLKRADYVSTCHLNYFFQIITVYFFKSFVVD